MAITRPLDLEGCHPEIKKALKAGLAISCYVSDWDEDPNKGNTHDIVAYVLNNGDEGNLYISSVGCPWVHAVPAKEPVKWIMPPEKAIPILIREGWKFDEHGDFVGKRLQDRIIHPNFQFLGRKLSDAPYALSSGALTCIIEEK